MSELESNIYNFFSKTLEVETVHGSQTDGVMLVDPDDDNYSVAESSRTATSSAPLGVGYAKVYIERERAIAENMRQLSLADDASSHMDRLDDITSMGASTNIFELENEALNDFYNNYTSRVRETTLPIDYMKDQILHIVDSTNKIVIDGPTGCGKTTQVPQWILDSCFENKKHCNIIVTQPRRIAAISIAHRVCEERGWELGKLVGYQVGLDSKCSETTRLQYVTTGVLLQKLVNLQSLNQFTHVILDEVHERGQEMDFLMVLVRRLAALSVNNTKVILMSATFNSQKFAEYFSATRVIEVNPQGMKPFRVQQYFLDDMKALSPLPEINPDEPGITMCGYMTTIRLLKAFDRIDLQEHQNIDFDPDEESLKDAPSVLIFLPGINEIEEMYKLLINEKGGGTFLWKPVALHSSVTSSEQRLVFKKVQQGFRKIILSTNIAESSITVPDVKYVIDFCLSRVLVTDPSTGFSCLQLEWAAHTSMTQRAGRAGRVRDGRVYRMVPKMFYESMREEPIPEMLRCPLSRLVLLSKMLGMGEPKGILALAMDPPDLSNITRTVLILKEVGGLLPTLRGEYDTEDGDITFLGRLMSKLPLDVHVSKLVIFGHIFGCLEECIIMGAMMSVRNIFITPFQERLNSYSTKLTWADRSESDCIAFFNVYKVYEKLSHSTLLRGDGTRRWAKQTGVSERALREARILVEELKRRLVRERIETSTRDKALWNQKEMLLVLKIVLAGSFYPHLFVQPGMKTGGEEEMSGAWKILCGRDARTTVYLTGWDNRQPQALYVDQIKKLFQHCIKNVNDIHISFDSNSSKIFVTFPREEEDTSETNNETSKQTIPGQVVLPVYKALKMHQLRIPMDIRVMNHSKANDLAIQFGLLTSGSGAFGEPAAAEQSHKNVIPPAKLPDIDDAYLDLRIHYVIDCGRFYAQYADQMSVNNLALIEATLNQKRLRPIQQNLFIGMGVAALYAIDKKRPKYYRAKVEAFLGHDSVKVQYVDYGNTAVVKKSDLRYLWNRPQHQGSTSGDDTADDEPGVNTEIFPAFAIYCTLSEISPSIADNYCPSWTAAANKEFISLTYDQIVLGNVYSVSHGMVALELFVGDISINQHLLSRGHAQSAEETYASKLNHNTREESRDKQPNEKLALNKEQFRANQKVTHPPNVPKINPSDLTSTLNLKGPFSPLECVIRGMLQNVRDNMTNIEWNSVNSVLLTNNPPDFFDRFVVSSSVSQSPSGSLTLRNTTLLPPLGGLGAMIALIFSPTARLRRTPCHSFYTAALVGLGANKNGVSYHAEHDMLIRFDIEMDNDDVMLINHVRYLMSLMLLTDEGQDDPSIGDKDKAVAQAKLKEVILKLISRRRRPCNPPFVKNLWRWAQPRTQRTSIRQHPDVDSDSENVEMTPPDVNEERAIFPMHRGLNLEPRTSPYNQEMAVYNYALHQFAVSQSSTTKWTAASNSMTCRLCGGEPLNRPAMRLHLQSVYHKERERMLPAQPDN